MHLNGDRRRLLYVVFVTLSELKKLTGMIWNQNCFYSTFYVEYKEEFPQTYSIHY